MPANAKVVKTRKALILGGYASLAAAFLGVGVIPYAMGATRTSAQIARTQREIDANLKMKSQLVDVEQNIELLKRQVANYPRLVPENQELASFLTQLGRELDNAGLKGMDQKALASITLGRTQKLPIELRGNGSFDQFQKFLVRLEHLERMCSVGRLVVDTDAEMSGKVSVELMLFIYNTKPG